MKILILLVMCSILHSGENAVKIVATNNRQITHENNEVGVFGCGTAFRISIQCGKGYPFLTAAHNILDKDTPYGYIRLESEKEKVMAKVLYVDKKLDIALLVTDKDLVVNCLRFGDDIHLKDNIVLCGSKRNKDIKECNGVIEELWHEGLALHRMKVKFDHGDSGGPVLCEGSLIGMAIAGVPKGKEMDNSVGLFLPISIIKDFLYEHRDDLTK